MNTPSKILSPLTGLALHDPLKRNPGELDRARGRNIIYLAARYQNDDSNLAAALDFYVRVALRLKNHPRLDHWRAFSPLVPLASFRVIDHIPHGADEFPDLASEATQMRWSLALLDLHCSAFYASRVDITTSLGVAAEHSLADRWSKYTIIDEGDSDPSRIISAEDKKVDRFIKDLLALQEGIDAAEGALRAAADKTKPA